ncbi:ankyrin repeat-containing domain protein [Lophiotrema nucula]|uniref:Ankyrin repeat-containing domain protein n=1 Tax=Lophiotrema nucula TaxID=690887 RepID=A0A6A5ZS15_9PLEO|nr:ankyrin repeat-containing domain protein [Lophiotrema nucula]
MANAGDVTRLFNLLEIHYTDKTERDYNEIRHLLESGVDPNALQPRAQDPVLLEAYYPHPPSSWPHLLVSPLYLASLSYDNKAINLLIEFGARFRLAPMSVPSEQRDTVLNPLMIPIFRNYLGTLHLILGVFDDDDLDDCTEDWKCQALVVVLRKGWFEKANILLHYDANLMRSTSPTFNSVEVVPHGLTHLVQELPKLSLALLFPGYEIHQFVHAEDSESHQAQSSMNVSVNSTDFGGCTALHIATGNVDERMCKYFIEGGADVNYLDELGLAPLHYATFYGHETATQFLLENGADVHLTANTNHSTPSRLEVAALDTIRRRAGILATFADLNWSAVHIAAYRGYSKIVTLLLKFGANGSTRDAKGALPLDIALKHRHTDTCIRFAAQGLMFSPFSTTHLLEQAIAWGDHELAERILITFDLNGTYDSSEIQEQKAKIQKLRSVFKLADTVLVRQTATSVGQRLEGPHLTLCPNCELELHGSKQYSSWERILSFYEVNSYCKGCQLLHDAAVSLEKAQGSPEPVEPKVMTDLVANLAIDDSASQNSVYFDWCFLRDQDTRIESLTLRIEDRAGVPSVKSDFHHSIYTVPG